MIRVYRSSYDTNYNCTIVNCYYIQTNNTISDDDMNILKSLIEPNISLDDHSSYVEWGTHLSMITPWCSNALSILKKCGVHSVSRIEKSYLIDKQKFNKAMIDPMTQTVYPNMLDATSFNIVKVDENSFYYVESIEDENKKQKLGFDETDITFYKSLFDNLERKPTNIELFDLAQSNSEHSRHWFFKGQLIDEKDTIVDKSLFDMVKSTQLYSNDRSIIAFSDNASALKGFENMFLQPDTDNNHKYMMSNKMLHPTLTAETHNFPTSVAPIQGAETGTGGRIRDNQAIGQGGYVGSGLVGYCVGDIGGVYYEKNLKTLIGASNGASDYGNKFGEPVIGGFCRTFGMDIEYTDGTKERREWVKPIMFSAGVGMIDNNHVEKKKPEPGMIVVKIGGPAYRIGIGGGAASSRSHDTKNKIDDLNAVQRGDAEMENRLNRVVRTCIEMGINNPILSIHDQGAGGTANVTKEIVYPLGADVYLDKISVGDCSMTPLEIWISEYQEQNTVLTSITGYNILKQICERENLPVNAIGEIKDHGQIIVYYHNKVVENLPLERILGDDIPRKIYKLEKNVKIPIDKMIKDNFFNLVKKVLSLPSVGSKRFLTNKVDRSVTGLVAQQQCVGPLHTPVNDYSITAHSYFSNTGTVTSIGEQPIKGLIDPVKMASLTIGEMLTNMIFAKITDIKDIRCSGNWMWPNKKNTEKNALYQACVSMCETATKLGVAFDGGKDSLSMSYTDSEKNSTIDAPRSLVVTAYAPMKDIRQRVTADFKRSDSLIYFIDLSSGRERMGASAFNCVHGFLGSDTPQLEDTELFLDIWEKVQYSVENQLILAGHDRSDGGLITTVCEMAFAGNVGVNITYKDTIETFFNEELGIVVEVAIDKKEQFEQHFKNNCYNIGKTTDEDIIRIEHFGVIKMTELRNCWEHPSYQFETLQTDLECVEQEYCLMDKRKTPKYDVNKHLTLDLPINIRKYKVAIVRDEGSNGDREMAAAFYSAGFEVYDICMNDLITNEKMTLESFKGIAFVGGFSYADVFGAGKGWCQVIKSNQRLNNLFKQFYERKDSFSFGVCNGCQLMANLEWIPKCKLIKNQSNRFESRFSTVKINKSSSIMFRDMDETVIGVWIAHGEGQFRFFEQFKSTSICAQYVNDDGIPTTDYPMNPNGSVLGIAAICSLDGRHLAMMPHPERCFLRWQMPYSQKTIEIDERYTPWFKMFLNAYQWCEEISA